MISVILPTIRPNLIKFAIDSIPNDVEIVVVADFVSDSLMRKNVLWIFQKERMGTVQAINKAYKFSSGDYIFLTNDETTLGVNALENMKRFCIEQGNRVLVTPKHNPDFNFVYYNRKFAAYPFAHRSVIDEINGGKGWLLDPAYKCFYADPDLSMQAHEKGIPVIEVSDAEIWHKNDFNAEGHSYNAWKYTNDDRETFRNRWAHLGELVEP